MNNVHLHPVNPKIKKTAHIDKETYQKMYQESLKNPEAFWGEHGKNVDWITPYTKVKNTSFEADQLGIKWFEDGSLNVSVNCIDRHLKTKGSQVALIWEGDDPDVQKTMTYDALYVEVCQFANALKAQGVRKGDVVCLYMPMVLEAAVAMLACTRIGAIHTVVFGGFSPEALAGRINDSKAKIIVTADEGIRAGSLVPLKNNVDTTLKNPSVTSVEKVIVYQRTNNPIDWTAERDIWWHDAIKDVSSHCEPEEMNAEDPLFILYTSGSTGTPKGVLHTTGGYLVYATMTFKYVFDYQEGEVFWCTADVGWITGHTYLLYGPLSNGAKTLLFEGVPNYPSTARMSEVIDKHQVNILYTAPTVIRALMAKGLEATKDTKRNTLRILGSVGEPINPEAWNWYFNTIGNTQGPVLDTWWQTETGGILITPLPGASTLKPGSANLPFFGVKPALVDKEGKILEGAAEGNLVILDSWPGQMRSLYGDHARFKQAYFSTFNGMYCTGDGARRDEEGDYWITGRIDDVLNVSGHRMGTAEIESALVGFKKIAEAAIVGVPHDIKGQAIYAYITLNSGETPSKALEEEVKEWVKQEIASIAKPDFIHWTDALPKTRSGKIMRRILRKIATDDTETLGDISTLSDPSVVEKLIREKSNLY